MHLKVKSLLFTLPCRLYQLTRKLIIIILAHSGHHRNNKKNFNFNREAVKIEKSIVDIFTHIEPLTT